MTVMDFTAIDFEAANSNRTSACSVGWATVRNGTIMESGSWLIRPHTGIDSFDPYAMRIHGITPQMVENAASLEESMIRLTGIIGKLPVLAHNAKYDRAVVHASCHATGLRPPSNEFRCTVTLAKAALGLEKTKLAHVAAHLGLPGFDEHDAAADALACARIALAIANQCGAGSIRTLYEAYGAA